MCSISPSWTSLSLMPAYHPSIHDSSIPFLHCYHYHHIYFHVTLHPFWFLLSLHLSTCCLYSVWSSTCQNAIPPPFFSLPYSFFLVLSLSWNNLNFWIWTYHLCFIFRKCLFHKFHNAVTVHFLRGTHSRSPILLIPPRFNPSHQTSETHPLPTKSQDQNLTHSQDDEEQVIFDHPQKLGNAHWKADATKATAWRKQSTRGQTKLTNNAMG